MSVKLKDQTEAVSTIESQLAVTQSELARQGEDFESRVEALYKRINKAEADRMDKYYTQVGELQDWAFSVKSQISESYEMTEALSRFFCTDHIVQTNNLIAEALFRTVDGR